MPSIEEVNRKQRVATIRCLQSDLKHEDSGIVTGIDTANTMQRVTTLSDLSPYPLLIEP